MKRIIVIGGGPAGMMAAISSKINNPKEEVVLIERNPSLGKKLLLSGGSRCNVTADVSNDEVVINVIKNGKFLYSSLNQFGSQEIIEFFNKNGCPLKKEDHHRMFPASNKANDVVNTLEKILNNLGVKILLNTFAEKIDFKKQFILIPEQLKFDSLIIATGGITYPKTGSDGNGYSLAKIIGHSITSLLPAEVPLVSNDLFISDKELMGLSFKNVKLDIWHKNKKVRSITHDLIFTHFGISGPAALRASYDVINILNKGEKTVQIMIDFLPEYNLSELENLTKEELNAIYQEKDIPKRLINYLISISQNEKQYLEKIKKFPIKIYTTRGMNVAFVTNGGISLKEIDSKTMKSKLNPIVSFCGEILDYNAYTGGYNITSALSTGYTAGKYTLTNL